MLKALHFANAAALITAITYVICAAWVWLSRESFMALFGTWFHGFDLAALPFSQLGLGGVIFGFVTATVAAWVVGYAFAAIYNGFTKQ